MARIRLPRKSASMRVRVWLVAWMGVTALLESATVASGESAWQAGLQSGIHWGGEGTRAGDIMGLGAFAAYSWSERWTQTFVFDRLEYDLETPVAALPIQPPVGDPPVDSYFTVLRLQSELEYHFRSGGKWDPFAGFGLGFYSFDPGPANGNTAAGGVYRLTVDAPDGIGVTARLGSDWNLSPRWRLGVSLSYSQTFRDFTVTDSVTGASAKIDAFAPLGVTTRIAVRF